MFCTKQLRPAEVLRRYICKVQIAGRVWGVVDFCFYYTSYSTIFLSVPYFNAKLSQKLRISANPEASSLVMWNTAVANVNGLSHMRGQWRVNERKWSVDGWSVVNCSEVLQCSEGLRNNASNIIRIHIGNMKLLLVCILLLSYSLGSISFIHVYIVLLLFNTVIYIFLLLCLGILVVCSRIFIAPAGTLRLPWMKFFRVFSSVVRQMPGYNPQRRGTARTLPIIFVLLYVLFVLCRSVYCLCVNVYCTRGCW